MVGDSQDGGFDWGTLTVTLPQPKRSRLSPTILIVAFHQMEKIRCFGKLPGNSYRNAQRRSLAAREDLRASGNLTIQISRVLHL